MNLQKVREIISLYKRHFHKIHNEEIYKWRAVKCFQEEWNIEVDDFAEMLERSLSATQNLLASGVYYPRRMILHFANKDAENVRKMFAELFDEEQDLVERINSFQQGTDEICKKFFPQAKSFQDKRAVLVYLNLRYPERYFLFKYEMFKTFVEKVEYSYTPKKGAVENILVYQNLCEILCEEIIKDTDLLDLHRKRLTEKEYSDKAFNILTQDVVYATARHLDKFENETTLTQEPVRNRLKLVKKVITLKRKETTFKGYVVNHLENAKERKKLGDLGELLVLNYEINKLEKLGVKRKPIHKSVTEGDGLGYDILSYNEKGEEIYIEVKTTANNYDAPFYVSQIELERSKIDSEKYRLYRLYNYDKKQDTALFFIKEGSLEDWCINPVSYQVIIEKE